MVPRLSTQMFYRGGQEDPSEFLLQSVLNAAEAPRLYQLSAGAQRTRLTCSVCGAPSELGVQSELGLLQVPVVDVGGRALRTAQGMRGRVPGQRAMDASFAWSCPDARSCPSTRAAAQRSAPPWKRQADRDRARGAAAPPGAMGRAQRGGARPAARRGAGRDAPSAHDGRGGAVPLRAVVCHLGPSIHAGHYTARARHVTAAGDLWWY
jgi:hypothetical protein